MGNPITPRNVFLRAIYRTFLNRRRVALDVRDTSSWQGLCGSGLIWFATHSRKVPAITGYSMTWQVTMTTAQSASRKSTFISEIRHPPTRKEYGNKRGKKGRRVVKEEENPTERVSSESRPLLEPPLFIPPPPLSRIEGNGFSREHAGFVLSSHSYARGLLSNCSVLPRILDELTSSLREFTVRFYYHVKWSLLLYYTNTFILSRYKEN